MNRSYGVALALLVTSTLSLQSSSVVATSLFDSITPTAATVLRLGLAAAILGALARPKISRWTVRQWCAIALLGLAMAGMNSLFYAAIDRIPLGVVATIEMLGPLVLAGILSKRVRDMAWVGVAMAGIVALGVIDGADGPGVGDTGLDPMGILFAVGAAAFLAAYIVMLRRVSTTVPGVGSLAVSMAVGAAVLLPIGGGAAITAFVDWRLFLGALVLGVFGSVVPYVAELVAARTIRTRDFGVLTSREPVFASLIGFVVLGQHLSWAAALAMVTVVSAAIVTAWTGATQDHSGDERSLTNDVLVDSLPPVEPDPRESPVLVTSTS